MLSEEERKEIEAELPHYANPRAVSIDAMKIVQRHRGWVSDEALADIGQMLDLSLHELDSVASFYNQIFRKPVGRHVIQICDSVSCWILGYERIRDAISGRLGVRLGETTADGRFTFLPVQCLGACDKGPALLVDADLHTDVEAAGLDATFSRYA